MTKLIIISLMAILTVFASNAHAQECMKEAWVKEEAQTQGGGFYWIPARVTDTDRERAKALAMIDAMALFTHKCGYFPVKKLAFNEVCVEEPGLFGNGQYTAYVRLTYTQADCRLAKEIYNSKMTWEEKMKYINNELYTLALAVRQQGLR